MTEPLPCPFCGEAPQFIGRDIECRNGECLVDLTARCEWHFYEEAGPCDESCRGDLVRRWNKRAPVKLKPCAECGCDMGTSADDQYCQQHS